VTKTLVELIEDYERAIATENHLPVQGSKEPAYIEALLVTADAELALCKRLEETDIRAVYHDGVVYEVEGSRLVRVTRVAVAAEIDAAAKQAGGQTR